MCPVDILTEMGYLSKKAYATHYLDNYRIKEIKDLNRSASSGQRITVDQIRLDEIWDRPL